MISFSFVFFYEGNLDRMNNFVFFLKVTLVTKTSQHTTIRIV